MRTDIGTAVETPARAVEALVRLLEELAVVIDVLSDEQYVQKPVGVMPSSVGGHVRHWLDHVAALRASVDDGWLNYDHRRRGTPIETDRSAAMESIAYLSAALRELTPDCLDRAIEVEILLTADGMPQAFDSLIGRELAYVVSHSVHHNAIIGAMVRTLGGTVPPRFGYAPSTIAHAARDQPKAERACAR
jgi:uncharacterized damage-inducible protein DinB